MRSIGYWATDIRLRAERKAGQLLTEMAENGERRTRGGDSESSVGKLPKLADLGVTKKLGVAVINQGLEKLYMKPLRRGTLYNGPASAPFSRRARKLQNC